jgi:hypothetical protein
MTSFNEIVALTLFFLPLFSSVLFAVIKQQYIKWLIYFQLAVIFICTSSLFLVGIKEFNTGLSYLNEPIYFEFSTTPIILFLIIQVALWIYLIKSELGQVSLRFHSIVLSIGLAFGFISFFSGQFMIRYIALEIVGLCVALSTITSLTSISEFKQFGFVFLILRTGDIGLWISILILQNQTQSLDISEMINAASQLPLSNQAWVLAGFLLAVFVKTAIWPFGSWLQFSGTKKQNFVNWIPEILMPSLGLYLLYRVIPVIQSNEIFLSITGLIIVVYLALLIVLHRSQVLRLERKLIYYSLLFGMAIFLSTILSSTLFSYYIWALFSFFTFMNPQNDQDKRHVILLQSIALLVMNGTVAAVIFRDQSLFTLFIWIGLTLLVMDWVLQYQLSNKLSALFNTKQTTAINYSSVPFTDESTQWLNKGIEWKEKSAHWFYQQFEIRFLGNIFSKSRMALVKFSHWVSTNIEMGLSRAWVGLIHGIIKISELTMKKIEEKLEEALVNISKMLVRLSKTTLIQIEDGGSKKTTSLINKTIKKLGYYEIRIQNKSFRWDLLWVPLFLVLIIIFIIISQRG